VEKEDAGAKFDAVASKSYACLELGNEGTNSSADALSVLEPDLEETEAAVDWFLPWLT
jgi:hypothetical protein